MDARDVGRRVRAAREAKTLDQIDIAERSGLSRAYVSRLESGGILNPKLFDLNAIAQALNVKLEELLYDPEPPLSEEEESDLARLEPQFKNLAFATGRRYEKGTPEERRQMLAILKALAGEEYREPFEDEA